MVASGTGTLVRGRTQNAATFLGRLRRDARGNTLAMMAAALIPISAMIGSGLDMARAYMTKSKLQTACDAAALAARHQMAGGQLDQTAIDEGTRFFNFNFPPGTMETPPVDLDIDASDADSSVVEVSASTAVPTTVMALFGKSAIPVDVSCSADQDYVNNDIMLILDVTGSMNCTAGSTNCSGPSTEQSNSRLSRLRNAAAALYRALEGADGVRTRYGFMPYSTNVNVGADLDRQWLRNPATYPDCTRQNSWGICTRWTSTTVTHTQNWFNNRWSGCIEERSTISLNNSSNIRISDDVAQADIDRVSTTDDRLKWQPFDASATEGYWYTPACPAPASRLRAYNSETAFQAQLNASLTRVGGNTNHDIGMVWGMRYLSSTGMFQADNPATLNDMRVDRHIVFLTDGNMTASDYDYTAYSLTPAETRLEGTGNQEARHIDRFFAACNRAREMGMVVWVIALDVEAPEEVSPCASGDDHFFVSDGSDLEQVFDLIGKGIGRLRITE